MNPKHVEARMRLSAHKTNQKRGVRIRIDKTERALIRLKRIRLFGKRLSEDFVRPACRTVPRWDAVHSLANS